MLTAVSLFAGIGGFDLAFKRAGVRVVAAVEIDKDCRGILARHFPQTALFNDVTEVTGDQLRAAGFVPSRGIITAGWPCQGNSVAGRRGGMGDARSGLWMHVARLLAELRPAWFIGENVPGLYSVNGGADIAVVRADLAQRGYWWAERILDAQWFGVPQRRRRVFFAGCLGDRAGPVQVLLEPEGGDRDSAAGPEPGARIAGTLAASLGGGGLGGAGQSASAITSRLVETAATLQGGGRRGHRIDAEGAAGGHLIPSGPLPSRDVIACDTSREGKRPDSDATSGFIVTPVAMRGRDEGGQIEAGEPGGPAFTLRTPGGGSSYPMIAHALTGEGFDASEDGTGRSTPIVPIGVPPVYPVTWRDRGMEVGEANVANALRSAGDGHVGDQMGYIMQPAAVRRLTPRECERLQGFPDDWTRWLADGTEQSDSARYRQCGNAVAVPVVQWIAERTVAVDAAMRASETEPAA